MAGLRILIAEDDPLVSISLSDQLDELGHTVVAVASDGQEAIDMALREKPEVALLDIKMPNVDGITAAERIAEQLDIPMLMLTAYSERHLVLRAAEAGALAYLLKPVSAEELAANLRLVVKRHGEKLRLKEELNRLEETLAERTMIDRAKAILMDRVGLTEDEAYSRIRQKARERRVKMVIVAQTIIAAEDFLVG
jgi:AmiR/NasT family two-component response regulator